MDPKRPETPEDRALEATENEQRAKPSVDDGTPVTPTEAKTGPVDVENVATDDEIANAHATTAAVDPADLFSSLDTGMQAMLGVAPDAHSGSLAIEAAADNVSTKADPFAQDAFAPPAIEEIVASLSAPAVSSVPAATVARDMVSSWQDLPADFGSDHDDATAERREFTNDNVPGGDPQSAPINVDAGAFMSTEPVEPPSGANEDFDTLDRPPGANPPDYVAIGNLLGRHDDPVVIQRGPVRTDDDSRRPSIQLLSDTGGNLDVPEPPSGSELSPRATTLQSPTSDGGPPLARPILLASVPDEQTRRILDEALAEAGKRDAKTAAEVAKQQVDDAFWLRACEERALYRGR